MVIEGKANISMTSDLLIYLPVEMFGIKMYTFTIPITIETDVPIDMFKQKEDAKNPPAEEISEEKIPKINGMN